MKYAWWDLFRFAHDNNVKYEVCMVGSIQIRTELGICLVGSAQPRT
jgi:hypothetical protein